MRHSRRLHHLLYMRHMLCMLPLGAEFGPKGVEELEKLGESEEAWAQGVQEFEEFEELPLWRIAKIKVF